MSGSHLSREFFDLVKAIGECRSKQEEDKIIEREVALLKSRFSDPANVGNAKKIKEFLVRAMYVEMLGHDASGFAYIHGVNLSHNKTSLIAKRVGYLACSLFLDPKSSELMLLLVNTIQKDLRSSNLLEISFALIVVTRLADSEMTPVLLPLITPLLSHQSDMIRRRAVVAFHRLVQVGGGDHIPIAQSYAVVRKSLCDNDPGVMAVGLNLLQDLANADPSACIELVPSLLQILKQVIDHRLPKDFEYHRMPAPWVQMRLVAILSVIGKNNDNASVLMYDTIQEVMRRADVGSNAGAAVVFECIKCASTIVPSHTLLEFSSLVVSKFLSSEIHNYKYLGVLGLSLIVEINPVYANEHQMLVVECLEDADDTLRRKTIDLLTKMTNPNNVTIVVEKMLGQLEDRSSFDVHARRDLVGKICMLCERFAPSNEWYLLTINQIYEKAGNEDSAVPASVAENLTRLVAEQDGEIDGVDLRVIAADEYIGWLEKFTQSEIESFSLDFVKLTAWMIGEFATLTTLEGYSNVDDIVDLLIDVVKKLVGQKNFKRNASSIGYLIVAVVKASVSASSVGKESARELLSGLVSDASVTVDIHRRCKEGLFVLTQPVNIQRAIMPFDAACEDIQIDLRFLDAFCSKARQQGAREYAKPASRSAMNKGVAVGAVAPTALSGLRFEAYQTPKPPTNVLPGFTTPTIQGSPTGVTARPLTSPPEVVAEQPIFDSAPKLNIGGPRRWGPQSQVTAAPVVSKPMTADVNSLPQARVVVPEKTPVPSVASSAPLPTLSKEYLEKQRMAAALFSGVSTYSKPASAASRNTVPKRVEPSPSVASAPAPQPDVDLLDLGGSPVGNAPKPTVVTASRSVSDSNSDLLG